MHCLQMFLLPSDSIERMHLNMQNLQFSDGACFMWLSQSSIQFFCAHQLVFILLAKWEGTYFTNASALTHDEATTSLTVVGALVVAFSQNCSTETGHDNVCAEHDDDLFWETAQDWC